MTKRLFLSISMIMALLVTSCIKSTYDMSMLSKKAQLSPTLALSAVKGDVSFSDMVKSSDTVRFAQDNLVILVFKKDSIINMKLSDFSKGTVVYMSAPIETTDFDLNIHDVLSHISGDFLVSNPTMNFSYTNSFTDSVKVNLIASATRGSNSVNLDLVPFFLALPDINAEQQITSSYLVDKTNSNLQNLISLPPEVIDFSGTVTLRTSAKGLQVENYNLGSERLLGSLELDIPLELKINNLQFNDTIDNFLEDKGNDNPADPADFQTLRVIVNAKNGFPLGASLKMSLFDSVSNKVISTINADAIIAPAAVDSNGKATVATESSTVIDFTKEFLNSINKADKIIFWFTLNSTGGSSQDVKIYSDYRISFTASLVVKPVINLK
jgi:hypothetical protein